MTDNWAIMDKNGIIETGTEEEIYKCFHSLVYLGENLSSEIVDWTGDLMLIEIVEVER